MSRSRQLRNEIEAYVQKNGPVTEQDVISEFDLYATGAVSGAIGRLCEDGRIEYDHEERKLR